MMPIESAMRIMNGAYRNNAACNSKPQPPTKAATDFNRPSDTHGMEKKCVLNGILVLFFPFLSWALYFYVFFRLPLCTIRTENEYRWYTFHHNISENVYCDRNLLRFYFFSSEFGFPFSLVQCTCLCCAWTNEFWQIFVIFFWNQSIHVRRLFLSWNMIRMKCAWDVKQIWWVWSSFHAILSTNHKNNSQWHNSSRFKRHFQ